MQLYRTIFQLDVGKIPAKRAQEMGEMGYIQWLGALPASVDYRRVALDAYRKAVPFSTASPAVGVFCDLLIASLDMPPRPLDLRMPARMRRGGARARRRVL